jgi:hypothetical protein
MIPLCVIIFVIVIFCFLAGIMDIVKARRKKQKIHYFFSGFSFLVVVAFVALLFGQVFLSLIVFGVLGLMGFFYCLRVFEYINKKLSHENKKQVFHLLYLQGIFLTGKAWMKLKAVYGFRKAMIIHTVFTTTISERAPK